MACSTFLSQKFLVCGVGLAHLPIPCRYSLISQDILTWLLALGAYSTSDSLRTLSIHILHVQSVISGEDGIFRCRLGLGITYISRLAAIEVVALGRTYMNMFIVFLACGIWHGAAWTFVLWGVYHGVGLVIERLGFGRVVERLPKFLGNAYTMLFVLVGWVLFRAESMTYAFAYLKTMFLGNIDPSVDSFLPALSFMSIKAGVLFVVGVIVAYPYVPKMCMKLPDGIRAFFAFFLFATGFTFAVTSGYSPFIYFRF